MAEVLNPKAKPGEPGYTSIFSGGLLVTDNGGNVVGNIAYGTEDASNALSGMPIYKTAQGNFTTKVPDIYAEFDKNTGNVVIHAPQEVLDMQSFKTNVLDSSAIKQMSAAYKIDPNYAFPDPEDDTKTISLQEMLAELNQGLNEYKTNVQKLVDEREKMARKGGEKYRSLSLDNVVTAMTFAQNDSDRQSIPNYLVDLFKDFESWDADSQSVSKDELMRKWWSYDVSDRDDLLGKWLALEAQIKYADTRDPENKDVLYSMQKSAFPDPDDAARMLSLEKFLEANDASTNTAAGVNKNVREIVGNELYSAAGQLSSGLLSLAALATSGLGTVKNPLSEQLATWGGDLEKSVEQLNDETEIFNKGAAVIGTTMQTLGNLGAILIGDVLVDDVASLASSALGKIDSWAKSLEVIAKNGKNISKGAEFVLKVVPAGVASKIITNGVALLQSGSGIAKFLGEVIVEAAIDNPQVMADFMGNKNNLPEVKQSLMEEAAYNGLGLAAGLGISKGLTAFASTSVGRAMNAALAVINARIETKVGDKIYDIRSAIAKAPLEEALGAKAAEASAKNNPVKAAKYLDKQEIISNQNEMRAAKRVLANMSIKDTDEIVEQIGKIKIADGTYDLMMTGSKRTYSAIVTYDPAIKASNKAVNSAHEKVIQAQKKAGIAAAKSAKYGSSGLSEAASQYVSLSQRMHIAEKALANKSSELYAKAKDALPVYQEQMKKIMENITPEMKVALDEYMTNLKTFYRDFTDWAIAKGLLSEETIKSYRNNPLFADNNYMRIVVEQDADKIRLQRADGLIANDNLLEIKHIKLPAQEQTFVDPEIVRTWYGMEIAKSYNAQNYAQAMLEATGATPTVMASAAEIKVARDVTAYSGEVKKVAAKEYSKLADNINAAITKKQMGNLAEARKNYLGSLSKQRSLERKIAISYKKSGVYNFTDDDLAKVLKSGGYQNGSAYDTLQIELGDGGAEAYDAWYKTAPNSMRQWLKDQRNVLLNAKIDLAKDIDGSLDRSAKVTFEQFSELQKAQDFGKEFDRQTVFASKEMMNSKKVVKAGEEASKNSEFLVELTDPSSVEKASENLRRGELTKKLEETKATTKENLEIFDARLTEVKNAMRKSIDGYVENVSKDGKVIASTRAMSEYGQGSPEEISRYLALRELQKPKNLDTIKRDISDSIIKNLPGKSTKNELEAYKKTVSNSVDSLVRGEYNDARLALDTINSKVINKKEWAAEIRALHKKISDASVLPNVIKTTDGNGGIQLVEVSPNLAFLYNYRPRRVARDGFFDKVFRGTSKLYRFGQTTFSSKSFIMQGFRDSGNAYFMGNAWRDIASSADNLVDVFGKNIVEEIKQFDPNHYEGLVKQVKEAGQEVTTENLARAEAQNIREFGQKISPATTETSMYTKVDRDETFDKMRSTTKNFADKLDSIFNGKREEYLRERVFMNALNEAMEQGYTYKQAQGIAIQMMNNATTNFSRSIYYLDSISENVPYIKSAINGTTSFWRMFSLDPVGVTGRLTGGLFMPYTYLLGQSLSDPENAEIYANIPEYEKRDSLVFVVRGQKISIPIPQEIGPIIAPFRHFVEYLWGAQKNNFWDLLGNDILGLSPIDLTGFSNVDMNLMTSDPTIADRLGRGTMRLISQLAPVPVKAGWIIATQTDPYTGKRIADTSWTYQDPETGEEIPMGYNQGKFAEAVAKMLKEDNAALVSKVISSVFGTTGEDVLDALTGLVQSVVPGEDGQDPLTSFGENFVVPQFNNAVRAIYEETYDRTNTLWRQAVRELEIEKDSITNSKEWKDIQSAMSQTKDATALKKLRARRQDMIDSYNQKVVDTANRLQSVYGGVLDRSKLGAVIQLLNFSTNTDFDLSNQYLKNLASEAYYAGRGQAIRTMQKLGVNGATDYSIFGYYTQGPNGEIAIKYTKPTAIIDMGNTVYGAKDIELANLEATLENAGITRSKMFSDEYYAAKSNKTTFKEYKANWNKQVLRVLAPYINSVGVDEVLNNSQITDYLDNYIFVDNPYKAKDYIKKLFKGE